MSLLDIENLSIHFHTREGPVKAVDMISFHVDHGEILAIVGESGSGKSVACYSLLNLIPQPPGRIESGTARFEGRDLLSMKPDTLRRIRGSDIAIIFQDPMTSLNPYLTVGEQLMEPLLYHRGMNRKEALQRAVAMLDEVGIADPAARIHSYPHEFSGGMRQRVMIAMALIAEPKVLICDEPTTALDVTIQAQILSLIKALQKRRNIAVIFISHDLAVVAGLADRVAVMKEGRIVETGPVNDIFQKPRSDYTRTLLASIPAGSKPNPLKIANQPLLVVDRLTTCFGDNSGSWFRRQKADIKAVDEASLTIQRGEILGLVGESGSGKSTLGRSILQLVPVTRGRVIFDGTNLVGLPQQRMTPMRRRMQMIFQDPYASLNPRMTVFDCLAEPLLYHDLATRKTVTAQVLALMDDVGLASAAIRKYPPEFSGGQRQRIALVAKHGLTMLFISHDLSVVRHIADRVAVMHCGKLVEIAETESLFVSPQHDYSRQLLSAIPALSTTPTMELA